MMTEEERTIIKAMSEEDAANDICDSLSHLLGRDLTAREKHCMSIKAKYWFLAGAQKQNLFFEDKLKSLRQENLPSYKIDYAGWHGEPE